MPDRFHRTAHDPVPTLVDGDPHQSLLAGARHQLHRTRAGPDRPPAGCPAQPSQRGLIDHPGHLGQVGLRHLVRRVGEPVPELPVVGQDQQALGVGVQAADVEQPDLALGHELGQVASTLGIVQRRDHTPGLVQHPVHVPAGRRDPGAVDPHHVGVRIDAEPLLADLLPVHLDPALADQLLGDAPGRDPGRGEHLLQTYALLRPLIRHARSAFDRLRVRFDRLRARRARGQLTELGLELLGLGQVRSQRGQLLDAVQPHPLQEVPGGGEGDGPGIDVVPGLGDQTAGQQGPHHAVDVHTADGRDPAPGDRLGVGDDGQCLQGRLRQLGLGIFEQGRADQFGVFLAGVVAPTAAESPQFEAAARLVVERDQLGERVLHRGRGHVERPRQVHLGHRLVGQQEQRLQRRRDVGGGARLTRAFDLPVSHPVDHHCLPALSFRRRRRIRR